MILRPMSDIHLEFDGQLPWRMPNLEGEEDMVLLLAGDVTANFHIWMDRPSKDKFTPWMREVCERHKHVIYIAGNHEYYRGKMSRVQEYWKGLDVDNFTFLDRDTIVLDGVRFIGCTMWTELPPHIVTGGDMNDFDRIKTDIGKFMIQDWRQEHEACRWFIEQELEKDFDGETVMVTHHAPSYQSIHDKYAGGSDYFYASNLEKYMWYNPIKYWIHGHTHQSMDYTVGDDIQSTRVVCNPRGYFGHDVNFNFDHNLTLEV